MVLISSHYELLHGGKLPESYFDIDTASAPQLRVALRIRNQEYEELRVTTYVPKVTEAHTIELTNLEKNKNRSLD